MSSPCRSSFLWDCRRRRAVIAKRLASAAEAQDWDAVREGAGELVSIAGAIGLNELGDLTARLCDACAAGRHDRTADAASALPLVAARAVEAIREFASRDAA